MNFQELIWREPWLAPVALNLRNVIATSLLDTAGVTPDGKTLYYNPDFWKSLKRPERLAVQIHELLHIVHLHAKRRNDRDCELWNIACDIAINYQIERAGYKLPAGALLGEKDSAEHIYEYLKANLGEPKGKNAKSIYSSAGRARRHDTDKAGGGVLTDDLLTKNLDGSDGWADIETLEAVESAGKLAGRGSTSLAAAFIPTPPKGDWCVVLQGLVKSVLGDDLDYLSYEFDEFGICEDILSPKPQAKICTLVDESGSIEDELYARFLGELLKMARFARVYAAGFTDGTELNAVPLAQYRRTMTGGTDVRPAYRQACREDYDCIIVLTDGCLEFPDWEPKPTIWAMPESRQRKWEVLL